MRLLLGDLGQGALAGVMAAAVARAAEVPEADVRRALTLSGDLAETAAIALGEGREGLAQVRLQVGRPLSPMLAATAPDVGAALERTGPAAVEYKLDGARVQIHRDGDEVAVFTRTLDDVTAHVPEAVEAALALPARTAVLDGEVIALRDDGRPHPFQVTGSRFGARRDLERLRREIPLSVFFFDLLHLDGADLLDAPLSERAAALDALAPDRRIPHTVAADAGAAQAELDAALAAGHEGVMVKALEAPYAAGRRGAAWLKVKPVHTLDLVVLAVEWGHGRRRGLPLQPAPRRPRRRRLGDARQDVQGAHRRAAGVADRALPRARDPPRRPRRVRAPRAGRRDRLRRDPDEPPLPGRDGAALRARQALPRRQARRGGRHGGDRASDRG